jgi:hypothetical protein
VSLILSELIEKLKEIDEITLMERLEISSEDLVEHFTDKIEEKFDSLSEEFNTNNGEYE